MAESIRVFASATVANVSCGFDVLGFAVNAPGDEIILKLCDKPGIAITGIEGDGGVLPREIHQNTAGVAILKFLEKHPLDNKGLEIRLIKKMPLGSGMGSSAASAVAGVYAINQLMGAPLKNEDLIPFAMEGERLACGSAHADNVAPSMLGGFALIRSYQPLDIIKLPTPVSLYSTLIHPHIEVKTRDARELLKKQIQLKDAVIQWGNIAGLITGLLQSDYDLIGRSMQDVIVEPIRSILIPGFEQVKQQALQAGALGTGISGSGPAIFSLSTSADTAELVGEAMAGVFKNLHIEHKVYVSKINHRGPLVLD
ncbi:MAG: homoserine kinase [Candidatus Cyclobacteriaceae bacterium M3_2C_046]